MESVKPRIIIEFGVNEGFTARLLLRSILTITKYYGVDVTPDYVPTKEVQRKEIPKNPGGLVKDSRFELMLRKRGSFDLMPADFPYSVCAAFIDGDHSRAGVTNDYNLSRQIVRRGGIIVFHDDHDWGTVDVRTVLDELGDEGQEIIHVHNTWVAYQRV